MPPPRPLVLVVTATSAVIEDLRRILEPAGIEVQPSREGTAEGAEPVAPDVILAAARLSGADPRSPDAELAAWAHRTHHDLVTPLAVIGGMAETLAAAWDRLGEADRARLLGAIRNQAARATTMLDDAFAVARGMAGEAGAEVPPTGG